MLNVFYSFPARHNNGMVIYGYVNIFNVVINRDVNVENEVVKLVISMAGGCTIGIDDNRFNFI